jgi:hypothetical protein
MKEITRVNLENATQVLGLDQNLLVYETKENKLVFYDYNQREQVYSIQLDVPEATQNASKKEKAFNCHFFSDKVMVLTNTRLHTFLTTQKTLTSTTLKHPANSGLLVDDRYIYYGTRNRELIKLSLNGKKVSWRFKLANRLRLAPVKIGPYITIIPEDNNIYFFTRGGSIFWWDKLNSTKLMPQIAMKENAAVFMWDNNLKFFNYKKKQVVTYPLRDWMSIKTNPVTFGEYIYFVMEEKLEENLDEEKKARSPYQVLAKIGNNYGVEVKAKPQHVWPKGKSIRFTLKEFNIQKPQYTIKIYKSAPYTENKQSEPVFEKIIKPKDKPSFAWLPEDALEYKMVIQIDGLNKKNVIIEETYNIIDLDRVLQNHFFEVQRRDENDNHSAYTTKKK